MNPLEIRNEDFLALFPVVKSDERIPWTKEGGITGFSILRKFPENSRFKPAVNSEGEIDTLILIRIGYYHKDITESKVPLLLNVSKVSRYNLDNLYAFRTNDDDPKSPTQESLIASKKSPQPIDLTEDGRFIFDFSRNKIFDTREKQTIGPGELIEYINSLFLKTATTKAFFFKLKIQINKILLDLTLKILLLCWDFLYLLGKKIHRDRKESYDIPIDRDTFYMGFQKTKYCYKDLAPEGSFVGLFGSEYKVSKKILFIISILTISIFILYDMFGERYLVFRFFGKHSNNQVFFISFLVLLYIFIDSVIPRFIIYAINKLIIYRGKIITRKFRFY